MNLLGKLDWNAIPLHEPIIMGATGFMVLVVVVVLGFVTAKGAWPYLWREWLTSVTRLTSTSSSGETTISVRVSISSSRRRISVLSAVKVTR